jgi:Resolvase, N terminal domain
VEFVKEQLAFTGDDSLMANLLLSVMGAFAEFQCALIRERQAEGIAEAKQRGAYKGRKKSLGEGQILALIDRAAGGEGKPLLAREFGVSRETVHAYLRTATVGSCGEPILRPTPAVRPAPAESRRLVSRLLRGSSGTERVTPAGGSQTRAYRSAARFFGQHHPNNASST